MLKLEGLGAGYNQVGVFAAIQGRLVGAEGLSAIVGVLGGDEHGKRVVEGKNDEGKHNSRHEESLRRGAATANLEDADPEETDAKRGDASDGATEQEEDEQGHEDIVNRECLGGLDEDPVEGLKDVDPTKDIAASVLAHGVHSLVDSSNQHRHPDDYREKEEKNASHKLDGPKEGTDLEPEVVQLASPLSLRFGGQSFPADEGLFLSD